MKVKKSDFETLLAHAKGLTGEARTSYLATLKTYEVYDLDAEGNEIAIEAEIVDEQPETKATDADVETKAAEATVIAKARKTFSINSAPSKFKTPELAKRARVKSFQNYEGQDLTAGERAYRFGMFMRAAATGAADAVEFCNENGIALVKENDGSNVVAKHNTYNNAQGALWVPTEFDTDLILLREQFGMFRNYSRIVPMGSDTKERMRQTGGVTAYFVGEGTAGTTSTMSWDKVSLTARKLMVLTLVTNEFNADATLNIGDTLAREIAYAFASKEDDCGFNGDGTSTYGGITGIGTRLTTVNGVDDGGGIVLGSGNAYSELTLLDFQKTISRLPQYADTPNTAWYFHKTFWGRVVAPLVTAAGGTTATELVNGVRQQTFLGYPVRISQKLPSTEANSQVCALFGDISLAADFGDRAGVSVAFSDSAYVGTTSAFSTDQVAMRGTERFDINVHDVGTSSAAGPVVGLITAAS